MSDTADDLFTRDVTSASGFLGEVGMSMPRGTVRDFVFKA
jgi:hypothetical protein